MILSIKNLCREFTVSEGQRGLSGAIKNLFRSSKKRTIRALDNVSFEIDKGEIVGLIGPNGAGKSTLVKAITGILPSTSGEIRMFGLDPFQNRIKIAAHYGVFFGHRTQLWWNLSARETFRALSCIYELDPKDYQKQFDYLVELLELHDFLSIPVRHLSLGQRVRCDIAAALLHKPKILLLDEPTIGVDVLNKEKLRSHLKHIHEKEQVSILLTSHDMVDIQRLCSRVLVIDKGKITYSGSLDELYKQFATSRLLSLDITGAPSQIQLKRGKLIKQETNRLVIETSKQQSAMEVLNEVSSQCEILDFSVSEMPIDEVIARIYRKNQQSQKEPACKD
jgi:ABC-2 type transport system ATP-binding protein